MGAYPSQYDREGFLNKFLRKNNVSGEIISKFVGLPEKIVINDNEYVLYINVVFFSIGDTFYNFELNYYSEDLIEFLFNSKVFNDVELSINYLLCELIDGRFITK